MSRTGLRSHELHNLTMPFLCPVTTTFTETPSGHEEYPTAVIGGSQRRSPISNPLIVLLKYNCSR